MYRTAMTAIAIVALAPSAPSAQEATHEWGEMNAPDQSPFYDAQFRAPLVASDYELQTQEVASGLVHPWAIAELPDGAGYLVTERSGQLRHVSANGTVAEPIEGVPEVENRPPEGGNTQAGLLDVKLGPTFAEDRMIYLTYAKPLADDMSATAAARGTLSEDLSTLGSVEDIFVQEPPSPTRMHYGSRIVFDDDMAFITTGEHSSLAERDFAQHLDKTYGKVVRVNLDGSVPEDNPFVGRDDALDTIWSYGHRNVQGAAMKDGFLYTIEHGPAGGDELNMPMPGRNYGWPMISYGVRYSEVPVGTGRQQLPGMEQPLYYWDPVIAPGDMVFYGGDEFPEWQGDILIAGLVSGGLVRLKMDGFLVKAEERLVSELGRVRDVEVLDDGTLLLATDYEDGAIVRVTAGGTN